MNKFFLPGDTTGEDIPIDKKSNITIAKELSNVKENITYTANNIASIKTSITELDTKKANISDVYNKAETDSVIDSKVTDKVAEIVADAPEDFDTLKEMSDWLTEHEDSAAAMNSAIIDNTNNITQLKNDSAINKITLGVSRKNLLKFVDKEYVVNGVTITIKDGVITLNGTATANSAGTDSYIPDYPYTGMPSDAQIVAPTNCIFTDGTIVSGVCVSVNHFEPNSSSQHYDNAVCNIPAGSRICGLYISLTKDTVYDNVKLYPMLRDADILDDTFEPYRPSFAEISAITKTTLGTSCKNLLNITAKTQTINGVTFTVNSDNSITISGTAQGQTDFFISGVWHNNAPILLPKNKYICSLGVNKNNSYNGLVLKIIKNMTQVMDLSNVYPSNTVNSEITGVYISLENGRTFTNYRIYPMIRYADITDSTYEPYAPSIDTRIIQNNSDIAINTTTLGTSCKNLLKNTATSTTVNGVTFTVKSDGSIIANGTATANAEIDVQIVKLKPNVTYKLSGCPKGGSSTTYHIYSLWVDDYSGSGWDLGSGTTIKNTTDSSRKILFRCRIMSGQTVSNITFKPMLRYADILDGTYEPYTPSIDTRITQNRSDMSINRTTLGTTCKNLLDNKLTSGTYNGVTFTVNDDKSVTLNGTATAQIWKEVYKVSGKNFRDKSMIFSGNPTDTGAGMGLEAWYVNGTTGNKYFSIANGLHLKESDCDPSGSITYEFHINTGKTFNNVTFYPMLRYADITDSTYEPYKPSLSALVTYQSIYENGTIKSCNNAITTGNYRVYSSATDTPSDLTFGDMRVCAVSEFISQTLFYYHHDADIVSNKYCKFATRFSIDNGKSFTAWTIFTGTTE